MNDKWSIDELNEARAALSIKKSALNRANQKIDGLKDDITRLRNDLNELRHENFELLDDLSSLLSASSELLQYLDPLEAEEAMKMFEDRGFSVKAKYEITVRTDDRCKNRYFTSATPIRDSDCSCELRFKKDGE